MTELPTGLKGKKIAVYLKSKGYRFSGVCLTDSELFIVLEDDRTGVTKAFAKTELSGWEVTP